FEIVYFGLILPGQGEQRARRFALHVIEVDNDRELDGAGKKVSPRVGRQVRSSVPFFDRLCAYVQGRVQNRQTVRDQPEIDPAAMAIEEPEGRGAVYTRTSIALTEFNKVGPPAISRYASNLQVAQHHGQLNRLSLRKGVSGPSSDPCLVEPLQPA